MSDDKMHFTRYPVISLGAEHLAMGYLLRRNILTYKAPPNNEGYDLICIHPNPRVSKRQIRVQVKSRLATDAGQGFLVKSASLDAFDFLIVAYLNVGYFHHKTKTLGCRAGAQEPLLYTFPASFVRKHHNSSGSWEKVRTGGLNIERYKNHDGFEQIARALQIPYPEKANGVRPRPR